MAIQYPAFRNTLTKDDLGIPDYAEALNKGLNLMQNTYKSIYTPRNLENEAIGKELANRINKAKAKYAMQTELANLQQTQASTGFTGAQTNTLNITNKYLPQKLKNALREQQFKNDNPLLSMSGAAGQVGSLLYLQQHPELMANNGMSQEQEDLSIPAENRSFLPSFNQNQSGMAGINYTDLIRQSLMPKLGKNNAPTELIKNLEALREVEDGYYPGTGRTQRIQSPEQQQYYRTVLRNKISSLNKNETKDALSAEKLQLDIDEKRRAIKEREVLNNLINGNNTSPTTPAPNVQNNTQPNYASDNTANNMESYVPGLEGEQPQSYIPGLQNETPESYIPRLSTSGRTSIPTSPNLAQNISQGIQNTGTQGSNLSSMTPMERINYIYENYPQYAKTLKGMGYKYENTETHKGLENYRESQRKLKRWEDLTPETKAHLVAIGQGAGIRGDQIRNEIVSGKNFDDILYDHGADPNNPPEPIYELTRGNQKALNEREYASREVKYLSNFIKNATGQYANKIKGYNYAQVKDALLGRNGEQQARFLAGRMISPELINIRLVLGNAKSTVSAIKSMADKSMLNSKIFESLVTGKVWMHAQEIADKELMNAFKASKKGYGEVRHKNDNLESSVSNTPENNTEQRKPTLEEARAELARRRALGGTNG